MDTGGVEEAPVIVFHFHAVFGKNCQKNRLAPPLENLYPCLVNPGSDTALLQLSCLHERFVK